MARWSAASASSLSAGGRICRPRTRVRDELLRPATGVLHALLPLLTRNHSWPEALKREIVAASFAPGSSVSMVARHYDVNANQVFSWRKRYRDEPRAPAGGSAPQLIPVTVMAETAAVATGPSSVTETIEIDLAGKYRVRVSSGVDAQGLRRVLDVLERR